MSKFLFSILLFPTFLFSPKALPDTAYYERLIDLHKHSFPTEKDNFLIVGCLRKLSLDSSKFFTTLAGNENLESKALWGKKKLRSQPLLQHK